MKIETLNILAMDLTHPNELPAGESPTALYEVLQQRPVQGQYGFITPVLVNQAAYALPGPGGIPRRFVDENFVGAQPNAHGNREQRLMHEMQAPFSSHNILLDRHGNVWEGLDWAFCHPKAPREVWMLIAALGIKHVVHYGSYHLSTREPHYLGIDLGQDSPLKAAYIRDLLEDWIDNRESVQDYPVFWTYKEYYDISMDDAKRLGLPPKLDPLEPIPPQMIEEANYPPDALSLGVDIDVHAHTGSYSEIVVPTGQFSLATGSSHRKHK